jgi:hypothetical protein
MFYPFRFIYSLFFLSILIIKNGIKTTKKESPEGLKS